MRVRKFGHSCLMVEERGEALLFDPGRSECLDSAATPDAFAGVSTIVVTHWHPDHADPELIRRIVDRSGATATSRISSASGDTTHCGAISRRSRSGLRP